MGSDVSRQAKPFKPEQFKDSCAVGLRALLQELPQIAAPPHGNVVNIMDALRKSLKAEGPAAKANAKQATTKRRSAR